jgi:pantoate--beta-alanine ligase
MGALHEGHLSLVRLAGERRVIASIFINPTQFNSSEDLANYPRTEKEDIAMLEGAGCDAVFIPEAGAMYPEGEIAEAIDYGVLTNSLEAAFRPGHFDGVVVIVRKLLTLVEPAEAYFGEKDFQQLAVVRELAKREFPGLKIIGGETVRDNTGLALSSRNRRLSELGKGQALELYRTLCFVRERWLYSDPGQLLQSERARLIQHPGLKLEYLEAVEENSFVPCVDRHKCIRVLVSGWVEGIRLIDNMAMPVA